MIKIITLKTKYRAFKHLTKVCYLDAGNSHKALVRKIKTIFLVLLSSDINRDCDKIKKMEEITKIQAPVLPGLKIVGKIQLPKKNKKIFKPFTGGITIGEVLKIQKIKLA